MKRLSCVLVATFMSFLLFAQDNGGGGDTKKVDVNINTGGGGGGHFWGSPILWIIGAAVFILLLVALTRGSGSRAD